MGLIFIGRCVWYILPAYLANMAPLVTAMALNDRFAVPLDFNRTLGGRPILGANKTYRGLVAGILIAIAVSCAQAWLYAYPSVKALSVLPYDQVNPVGWGLLMGVGALGGDAAKSFLKRLRDIEPGHSWKPLDQIDFLVGALALSSIVFTPPWTVYAGVLIVMSVVKVLVAQLGFAIGIRPTRW